MFNVQQITSHLATMSDAQLSQYARMHKEDPYILPLAASESKRRQQMRQQATAGQAAQNQPTVADQAVEQMGLPEEQGIGMLPAKNLETMGMASGGIAGYAGNDASLVQGSNESLTPAEQAELDARKNSYWSGIIPGIKQKFEKWREGVANIPLESSSPMIKYATPKRTGIFNYEQPKEELERLRKEEQDTGGGKYQGQSFGVSTPNEMLRRRQEGVGYAAPDGAQVAPTTQPQYVDARSAPVGEPVKKNVSAGKAGPKGAAPSSFEPTKTRSLEDEMAGITRAMPDVGGQYDKLQADTEAKYANLEKERAEAKPKGEAYAGLEALLKKEEDKTAGKEDRNINMALINAGLAIAGGKSQYALSNIAEGAQVGTKQYQAGLDKLEDAAKERQKQSAMIEEARRSEAKGDWQEAMKYKQMAVEMGLGIQKSKIDGVAKITGESVKLAADRVNTLDTLASQDRRAIMQQQEETKRNAATNATHLQSAGITASMYGGRAGANIPNLVYDNATKQHQLWLNSPEGKLASLTPGAADRKFQEYLEQAARVQGYALPGATNAAPSGGATAPKAKFLGFE